MALSFTRPGLTLPPYTRKIEMDAVNDALLVQVSKSPQGGGYFDGSDKIVIACSGFNTADRVTVNIGHTDEYDSSAGFPFVSDSDRPDGLPAAKSGVADGNFVIRPSEPFSWIHLEWTTRDASTSELTFYITSNVDFSASQGA